MLGEFLTARISVILISFSPAVPKSLGSDLHHSNAAKRQLNSPELDIGTLSEKKQADFSGCCR